MTGSSVDFSKELFPELQRANEHLAAEIAAAAQSVCSLMDHLRNQFGSIAADQLDSRKIASFEHLFSETENSLFSGPLGTFEKLTPIERSLSAIERHRLEVNDLARRLPTEIEVSGRELAEMTEPIVRGGWKRAWLKRRKSPRPLKFRGIVRVELTGQIAARSRTDGEFELVLAQAGLHLLAAWQVYRRHRLAMLAGDARDRASLDHERKWWNRTARSLDRRLKRLVGDYEHWTKGSLGRLGHALLRRSPQIPDRHLAKMTARWQADFSRWRRQQRAVRAVIDLERELSLLAGDAIEATRQALESSRAEHDDVVREMDEAIAWLQRALDRGNSEGFPPPRATLLSAEQHAREWNLRISAHARARVPTFVEAVRPARILRRWRQPWRQLHPQRALQTALDHAGFQAAREGLREVEAENTTVVRDIEQARQVVTFGLEASRAEGSSVKELPREATANALALLQHRKESLVDPQPAAEAGFCRAQALVLLQTHTDLDIGRLGLLALLTRQGAPRAAENLGQVALASVRGASRVCRSAAGEILRRVSWQLGWEQPLAPSLKPVIEQVRLGTVLEVRVKAQELPALYQHLFRLTPVEDQRFLVGRETEMGGLDRAFSLWQSGRRGAVLVVGARGSGKTSLLNCAAGALFTGVPVVRGEFCRRIRSSEQMSTFLRELFQVAPGADFVDALSQGRRVAVIEEFERSFLRCINGFDALREFLRLINDTSASTLWILSINGASFRYLDAVLGLGRNFSHILNAMSVSEEHMTEAILQRHTLSGLRLQFAPSPAGDPRINRLRRFFGFESTPQQMFFDSLYRQSEGLFRSAFDLWLGSVERIEGTVLRMVQPLDPNYTLLESELNLEDRFVLQAILQHASLTKEEVAEVFQIGLEEARGRLERLLALEILESEPSRFGLRVRPRAARFVREALDRQNLL